MSFFSLKLFKSFDCSEGELQSLASPSHSQVLVDYLRSLRLTGTKRVCGEGVCGACTVLLSRPNGSQAGETLSIHACTTRIVSLHGTSITTVEVVGSTRSGLHPVQVGDFALY